MTLTADTVGLYAETLVRQAASGGLVLDYTEASLATLDALLSGSDPAYATTNPSQRDLVIFYAGCYLGEVLVRSHGAHWHFAEDWSEARVRLIAPQGGLELRPFEKLYRRLTEGAEGNRLTDYYQGIAEALERRIV
jgi:Family of unknown function (DUF6278)